MKPDEYVEQVDRMMGYQNTFVTIFIGILSIVLVIFFVFQWRLSSSKVAEMENNIKEKLEIKHKEEMLRAINDNNEEIYKNIFSSIKCSVIMIIRQYLRVDKELIGTPLEVLKLLLSIDERAVLSQNDINVVLDYVSKCVQTLDKEKGSDTFHHILIKECECLEEIINIVRLSIKKEMGIKIVTLINKLEFEIEKLTLQNSKSS